MDRHQTADGSTGAIDSHQAMNRTMQGPTRREVIVAVAAAGVFGAGGLLLQRPHTTALAATRAASGANAAPPNLAVLSPTEYLALAAACDRIYPPDDSPGAIELGVPRFVDRALAADPLPSWADGFLTALARLDAQTLSHFGVPFCRATTIEQDTLIAEWAAETQGDHPQFVRNLVVATLEGVLGDPSYGGNLGGRAWKALGLRPDPFAPSAARLP